MPRSTALNPETVAGARSRSVCGRARFRYLVSRAGGIASLYETRPVAALSANSKGYRRPVLGGLSAGVGTKHCGTMGGVVQDQQSPPQKYGVTCAHVMTSGTVEQPAQIDSKRAAAIGTVSTHTSLQLPVGLCTPKSATGVNTVDIALIEIDPSTSADLEVLDIGPLTGVTPIASIGQGQTGGVYRPEQREPRRCGSERWASSTS